MPINKRTSVNNSVLERSRIGLFATGVLVGLSVLAIVAPFPPEQVTKVLAISWVAFAAMGVGGLLGARAVRTDPHRLVWGYGLASGAMITSSAVFLLPQALNMHARIGGFGVATGLIAGYGGHVIGHRLSHVDVGLDLTAAQITAHALSAGLIIGLVYGSMPELGLLLGLAIVSHKGPAGYAAANRLRESGKPVAALLLPAAAVGLTAIPSALLPVPSVPLVNAVVFGFAAGVFLHVAMDFLPSCEVGGEIHEVCGLTEHSHALLDTLRTHAVASTMVGGVAVLLAWIAVEQPALLS